MLILYFMLQKKELQPLLTEAWRWLYTPQVELCFRGKSQDPKVVFSRWRLNTSRAEGVELLSPVWTLQCAVTFLGWWWHRRKKHELYGQRAGSCPGCLPSPLKIQPRCTFDTAGADGLNKTQQGFSILRTENRTRRMSSCTSVARRWDLEPLQCFRLLLMNTGMFSIGSGATDSLLMTSAGICVWNNRGDLLMTPWG